MPCAAFRPRPCTSARVKSSAARRCPPCTMPNSAAALIEFEVSRPALARPMTFAFEAGAGHDIDLLALLRELLHGERDRGGRQLHDRVDLVGVVPLARDARADVRL